MSYQLQFSKYGEIKTVNVPAEVVLCSVVLENLIRDVGLEEGGQIPVIVDIRPQHVEEFIELWKKYSKIEKSQFKEHGKPIVEELVLAEPHFQKTLIEYGCTQESKQDLHDEWIDYIRRNRGAFDEWYNHLDDHSKSLYEDIKAAMMQWLKQRVAIDAEVKRLMDKEEGMKASHREIESLYTLKGKYRDFAEAFHLLDMENMHHFMMSIIAECVKDERIDVQNFFNDLVIITNEELLSMPAPKSPAQ